MSLVACSGGSGGESSPATDASAVTATTVDPAPTVSLTLPPPPTNSLPPETSAPPTTEAVVEPLQILVTNDDGVGSAGIDALVEGLRTLEFVELTVVAPLENQSGKGDQFTDPAAGPLVVSTTTTLSGFPATAVAGTPADSIIWAIELNGLEQRPDFVVAGINNGQNMSTSVIPVSGTIGAARRSAVNGIPSIAVSFSTGDTSDYTPAVQALLTWFTENAPLRIADAAEAGLTGFTNMNVANCPSIGKTNLGPVAVQPGELGDRDYGTFTCDGAPDPADDVAAYQSGYIAISELPLPA